MNVGGMLNNLTFTNIIGGLIFSSIGMFAFSYGKKVMNVQLIFIGVALMGYCFFVSETLWVYLVGSGLTAAAYFARNAE